jgi:hypothetical protein
MRAIPGGRIAENVMAIGKRKTSGDFLPMLKYDARVGKLYFQDRVYENGRWETPDDDFKEGIRILVKMDASLGGNVRELMSTAVALWNAMDALHDAYLAGTRQHLGALPVVDLDRVTETRTSGGASVAPIFKIVGWIPRPPDLPLTEMAKPAPKQKLKARPKPTTSLRDDLIDEIPSF